MLVDEPFGEDVYPAVAAVEGVGKRGGVKVGAGALYDGMSGELLKGFFSHGTTMLSKDVIHRFIVQLYFAILAALRRYPQFRMRISERMRGAREQVSQRYLQVSSTLVNETRQGGRYVGTHLTPGKGKVVESK